MLKEIAGYATLAAIFSLSSARVEAKSVAPSQKEKRNPARVTTLPVAKEPSAPPAKPGASATLLESEAGPSESEVAKLARVRARREAVEKEILKLQGQTESTLRDLEAIDLDLRLAAHRFDEATLEFKETARRLDATLRDIQQTRDRLEIARPRVLKSLTALSKLGELSYARLLFSLDDPADILRGYRYVSRIASADGEQIREFRASLLRLNGLEEELKKRTASNLENRRRLNEARRTLSARKSAKEVRIAEIARKQRLQEQLVGEYQKREQDLERLLRAAGELDSGGRPARRNAPPIAPFRGDLALGSRKGGLPWPVSGTVVKRFGVDRDLRFGTRTLQQGVEIDAFPEVEVHAVHPGRVVFADQFIGYGLLVIIDHGNREHTLYGRLGELLVSPGDDVDEGSLLGLLPNTRVTGTGLHFEVRVQGKPEDPLDWLKKP